MPEKLSADPPLGQHGCEPCSCSVFNAVCSAPQITCWTASDCQGTIYSQGQETAAGCVNGANPPPAEDQPGSCSLTAGSTVVAQGNCSTSGGFVVNAPDWGSDVRACNKPLTGTMACGVGGTCEPVGIGEQLCIRKTGTDPCPAGWDVSRVESFAGEEDLRSCSPCGCNAISCAGGSYTVYEALDCNGAYANVPVNGAGCTVIPNVSGTLSSSRLPALGSVVQNGCFGGGPMGAFTPTGPVTFCCKN
jgi:hypothetical protein